MVCRSPTGVGEVKGFVEVDVEIGFRSDAERSVIVFIPDGTAVPFAQWASMHADGGDGNEFPELLAG
jgi:hypothetical protein